jgi:hypothetical protein
MVMLKSSVAVPTPLFPNTTAHKHYATPTLKIVQAAETSAEANSAVGGKERNKALFTGLLAGLALVALVVD